MDHQQQCILNHLKDMFASAFDEDIIEAVLLQHSWDVDRAVDDLMTMTLGNSFEIPVEEVDIRNVDSNVLINASNFDSVQNLGNSITNHSLAPERYTLYDDTKVNNDDDGVLILDEEEYVVPTESDDSESITGEISQQPPIQSRPTMSYASMAQKPPSENAIRAAHEHAACTKPPYIIYQGYTSYDRIKRTRDSVERVKLYVQNRFKIMVILRGCPGSGKSSLAKTILTECNVTNNPFTHIHSTDNFFCLNNRRQYLFDLDKIDEAHNWNQANVISVIREGLTPIIVDNTNTEIWEMEKYASMAVCAGYEMEVIEPDTPWAFNINQLLAKNIHDVSKDKLYAMLDRYEHNVSATTLLKTFNLKYSPSLLPPQNGVRTLKQLSLINTFERIYKTICVLPEKVAKSTEEKVTLTKAQKKRERRKLRKLIEKEAAAAAAFVELDELTETDSGNSVNDLNVNDDITADEEEDVEMEGEESDSDPSWLTVDDESVEECNGSDEEEAEENKLSSADSDLQNESFEKQVDEAETMDFVVDDVVEVPLYEENTDNLKDIIPAVMDRLQNPLNIDENEPTISNIGDAIPEVNGSRLKCFEKLRDNGKIEEGLDNCIEQVLNNVLGIIKDEEGKDEDAVVSESSSQILNNAQTSSVEFGLQTSSTSSSSTCSLMSELLGKSNENIDSELMVSKKLDNNSNLINALENLTLSVTKTTSPSETYSECCSKSVEKLPEFKIAHNLSDAEISTSKNNRTPEKGTDNVYNTDTRDRKLKLCNIEGQKNDSVDIVSDTTYSYKFKDDPNQNVIANDLWGKVNENRSDVKNDALGNEEKELSDDNSDNSDSRTDSRSNSSSSDDIAITDVHNTSNRFVNNDIKNEQNERKKPDINLEKKSQNVGDDMPVENAWYVADSVGVPELNTLKERILINSLDKVFNQNQNIEPPCENASVAVTDATIKQSNLPQCRSTPTTSFHIIENKLKNERKEGCSPSSSRSEDFEDAIDSSENRFLNQWMRGDSWDDSGKDMQEFKKNEPDIKPPRKMRDSPSKQKNTETASNIRLVNDIRNVSDNSKMCLLLDKKNKNQDSMTQPLKSTNFQSQFWLDRSSPRSWNTMQRMPSKEDDIESDFEAKSISFHVSDDHVFESQRNNQFSRTYPSPFKNFDANESQFWPGLSDGANALWGGNSGEASQPSSMNNNASPELLDSLIARHRNIARDENSSDFEKSVLKWSPFSDSTRMKTVETVASEAKNSNNYFVPLEIMNQERNKATNTGIDDSVSAATIKIGRCREINEGRWSPEKSIIELNYKCDKSTMADGSSYTLKAKPLKEDLENIFPIEMVDVILDLYDKCNGNMDWIIEILMEDGYSPSDDQLEYLSSLQNMIEYQKCELTFGKEKMEKEKKISDKKKGKSRNSKNGRGNNSRNCDGQKRAEASTSASDFDDYNCGEGTDTAAEEHVDLFLDWCTVSQLLEYFGNPTIYSIRDYQPTVKLPISLARQLHAYLIGSIIDQAEENEDLINQLSEEDHSIDSYIQSSNVEELSQKDVIEVENSLSDILKDPFDLPGKCEEIEDTRTHVVRNKDSFASKLSLNLLLKAFPSLDSSFVRSTFKSQNFNYYDTKNVLNQYGKEIPVDAPRHSPLNENDLLESEDDVHLFGNHSSTRNSRSEVLQQVTEFRRNASTNQCQWRKCHENLRRAVQEKKFGVAAYYRDIMNVFKQKYEENNAHAAAVLINSCCLQYSDMIDLHYFKVTEALKALDKFLDEHLERLMCSGRSRMTLYIITGRGARSVNGVSRIQPPVKNRLKRRNISFEVESYNTGLVKAIIRKNSLMSTDL